MIEIRSRKYLAPSSQRAACSTDDSPGENVRVRQALRHFVELVGSSEALQVEPPVPHFEFP